MNITEIFGSKVFNDSTMKQRLPKATYKELQRVIHEGANLELSTANVIANAMKDWAIEQGVTHFTHWFQPMTGITAEKHDSFISPTKDGGVLMEFSGKELIKGEPDASSFPSGGLRATFEARGYTAWDPTSPAFIKGNTLCIPTAFSSYTGEVLDKKTPLLRSMDAVSAQAIRLLALLGKKTANVSSTVGPEQEYFLVDKKYWEQRRDLILTGRTLFGAMAPKGQELDDHYFGTIKTRVAEYMEDLDQELWKLGVLAKTKHNEVAPAQHELAPIYSTTNIATDHNQLTMEMMKRVAGRHGLVCLLHEKPFDGVNGSGKHNNWSLNTAEGENLLEPTKKPYENLQFLLFLTAVIKGIDEYQDLMRISVASAANDHRLGANEAPPAIVSMFLGDELTDILDCIESGKAYVPHKAATYESGVSSIPNFIKDTTDRNRTSPFAFTGNKFEFRMLGSSDSIACTNIMLNTIVADELKQFCDKLEKAKGDQHKAILSLIKEEYTAHKRIVFNGNNYSDDWVKEAKKRGLLNLASTADALPMYTKPKNVKLFATHKIYTKAELESRQEILLENYNKTVNIEALTMVDMVKKDIVPAVGTYVAELSDTALSKKTLGLDIKLEVALINKLSKLNADLYAKTEKLSDLAAKAQSNSDTEKGAKAYRSIVLPAMEAVRAVADELEMNTAEKYWPMPTYDKLLFGV